MFMKTFQATGILHKNLQPATDNLMTILEMPWLFTMGNY